jgi:hypothetical protein
VRSHTTIHSQLCCKIHNQQPASILLNGINTIYLVLLHTVPALEYWSTGSPKWSRVPVNRPMFAATPSGHINSTCSTDLTLLLNCGEDCFDIRLRIILYAHHLAHCLRRAVLHHLGESLPHLFIQCVICSLTRGSVTGNGSVPAPVPCLVKVGFRCTVSTAVSKN